MTERCHNCGELGHRTRHCTVYGPRFLEPGKTIADYAAEAERIAQLFAADIIMEHGHAE
jgi:hypothetical protein